MKAEYLHFSAPLKIIGVNPYLEVPEAILAAIFLQSGKDKGSIPICGEIKGQAYTQSFVRFKGEWRLYVNMKMLKDSPQRIGEVVAISLAYDPKSRVLTAPPLWLQALEENAEAGAVFAGLRPSLQHEIVRYLVGLKTEESLVRNIARAVDFLLGKGRFVVRARP